MAEASSPPPAKEATPNAAPANGEEKKPKRVRIVIRSALNVPPPSWVGMKEPYASIRLGRQHFRTAVAKDAERPEWNETVVFTVDDVQNARITVRLWENDFDASKIGLGSLAVNNLRRGAWTNVEVPLEGGSAGPIIVRVGLFAINFGPRVDAAADVSASERAKSPTKAQFAPKITPQSDPVGFAQSLHDRIDKLRADCIAAGSSGADSLEQDSDYAAIIHSAMELEKHGDVNDAVSVLSHVVRVSHIPDISSLALNNLGCVETRRNNADIAVHHLERACDIEGGMEHAKATTLTNLAVAFTALKRYTEACALAHHASQICEATPDCRPAIWSSALYNLAVALEYAGELKHAAAAFEKAANVLPIGHPSRAMLLSQAQQVRESMQATESEQRWRASNQKSIISATAEALRQRVAKQRNNSTSPPLKSATPDPSRESPALARRLEPLPSNLKLAAREDATMGIYAHTMKPQRLRRIIDQTNQSPLALKALRSVTPVPASSSTSLSPAPTQQQPNDSLVSADSRRIAASSVALVEPPRPEWNYDPFPAGHPMSHRTVVKTQVSHEIEHRINERFIPRKLLPLLTDLLYKENTRRATIVGEWKRQLKAIARLMELHRVISSEDEARAALASDQNRVRRVLQNWVRGRLVFASGCLETEAAEAKSRDKIAADQQKELTHVMGPRANVVRLMATEETARRALEADRRDGLSAFKVKSEALLAELRALDVFKDSNAGVADALTVWTLESVFPQAQVLELMPPSAKSSLFVMERYSMFGHPASHQAAPPKKRTTA